MIESSSKAAIPAKLDWSKPIRRTDKEFSDATGFRVLVTDLEGEFPVVVSVLGYGRPITLHYRKDGSHMGCSCSVWENVPEEEWVIRYTDRDEVERYSGGPVLHSLEEVKHYTLNWNPAYYKNKRAVRLSDGHTENID